MAGAACLVGTDGGCLVGGVGCIDGGGEVNAVADDGGGVDVA